MRFYFFFFSINFFILHENAMVDCSFVLIRIIHVPTCMYMGVTFKIMPWLRFSVKMKPQSEISWLNY